MKTNRNPGITRREFFRSGVLLSSAVAVSGIRSADAAGNEIRHPAAHFKVSCAAYSYRKYLKRGEMNLFDFIDRCVDMDIDAVELTSYYFPEKITTAYLNELKRRTFLRGLDISGTAIANNFCVPPGEKRDKDIEHVKKWIDYAVGFSAPCIRIFAGNPEKGVSQKQAIQWTVDAINTCLDYAGKRGVFLALENHGGIVARAAAVKTICDKVGPHPWFGVNLDTGNFRTDPYGDMKLIAPYAITVQVKDWVTAPNGKTRQQADLKKVLDILRGAKYRGYLALEYEGKEDPKTGVPKWIARLKEEAYK